MNIEDARAEANWAIAEHTDVGFYKGRCRHESCSSARLPCEPLSLAKTLVEALKLLESAALLASACFEQDHKSRIEELQAYTNNMESELYQLRAIVDGGEWVSKGALTAMAEERDMFKIKAERWDALIDRYPSAYLQESDGAW